MPEAPFYTYVLYSAKLKRCYTGSTNDLRARLHRHNTGQGPATKAGVPWVLVHCEPHPNRSEATKREMYFKTGKGRDEVRQRARAQLGLD